MLPSTHLPDELCDPSVVSNASFPARAFGVTPITVGPTQPHTVPFFASAC